MLKEFIAYLTEQVSQPYLWGGQHTKLTPENYKTIIAKKESSEENRRRVETYCEKMFADGNDVLYAYDCSGLGCYWLCNLTHLYKCDVNANTMMGRCEIRTDVLPSRGWWVFRTDGNRAVHIGYMVDDETLIEAKGRDVGVCLTKFRKKDWDRWGIPNVFRDEIVDPPAPPAEHYVEVIGGSVNVRTKDSKAGRIMFIAHRGDKLPYVETAPSGWYEVVTKKGNGFITNLPRYTRLV